MKAFVALTLLVAICVISLTHVVPAAHAWEKANGYPFGKMCHSVFTMYANTCR